MVVRGGTLTTEGVWDDTDIVHIVYDEIVIPDLHTYGGLRLESSPTESLVVKLDGQDAGFQGDRSPAGYRRSDRRHAARDRPAGTSGRADLAGGRYGRCGLRSMGRPQNDTDGPASTGAQSAGGFVPDRSEFRPGHQEPSEHSGSRRAGGRIWERLIEDPITVTYDFELADQGDGILGGAIAEFSTFPYDAVRQAMISDGRPHETVLPELPTFAGLNTTLPDDPANPFSVLPTIRLTNSNAKALGLNPALITQVPSQYDPTESRDANIIFNLDPVIFDTGDGSPAFFDYDRSDGIQPLYTDFIATVAHEMGHALGFISAVDDVDAALAGGGARQIQLEPLDLFRFEPGDGAVDFTNAPRALDPTLVHVFHDGGTYDPFGIAIPGLRKGDIPLSTGQRNGDGAQASHWKDDALIGTYLGLMDPTGNDSVEENLTDQDLTAFDLIGWDIVGGGLPGDWRGLTLEQYSQDRNVSVVTELESGEATSPGTNALPTTAEYLGVLGRGEKDSDDNLRLGFEVHGFLNQPSDIDVYSFKTRGGTEVWLDIDRTTSALDTVVELVDANGRVLARSDNSLAEQLGDESVFAAADIHAYGLQRSVFRPQDFYTTNPKDAGFRVVLPGAAGGEATYHVRVRSSSPTLNVLSAGQTSGVYQLQVRLQDLDEFAGSTVQYADIHYAVDGIRVKGLPRHSPLAGETAEDSGLAELNDDSAMPRNSKVLLRATSPVGTLPDFKDVQSLGNILASDRATISIAGKLDSLTLDQADWYMFEVTYESLQQAGGNTLDVTFDLDYADGLGRADITLSVYEAEFITGNPSGPEVQPATLVFSSRDSAVADDQPGPLAGDDLDDLSRGTVGKLDPFLGPVSLAEGFYLVKLEPTTLAPTELGQFTERLPSNPYIRSEPIDSMVRVAQDNLGDGPLISATFDPPQVPVLLSPGTPSPTTWAMSSCL